MAIAADTLNIKINDLTFTTCDTNNTKKDRIQAVSHWAE